MRKVGSGQLPTHAIDDGYITEWLVLGPFFPQDLNTDFLADAGGEANIQPQEGDTFLRADGTSLTWKRYTAKGSIIDLIDAIGPYENATAYAFCILQSEPSPLLSSGRGAGGEGQIHLGSDDGITVWINGKRIHNNPAIRNFVLDEDMFEVDLKVGANRCLVKVSQGIGDWCFAMRVAMLPKSRAVLSGVITDEASVPISDVDVCLEQDGLVIVQTRTDVSGSYRVSVHPVRGTYTLSATKGDRGDWQLCIHLREGERRKVNLTLKEAINISGRLLMLDEMTPHVAVPVQAVIPYRNELRGDSRLLENQPEAGSTKVVATTKSDERGKFQFINLKPGQYQVRCQKNDGYLYYKPSTNDNGMGEWKNGRMEGKEGSSPISSLPSNFPPLQSTIGGGILEVTPNTSVLQNLPF